MLNNYKQNKILPSLSALALINTAAFSGIVAGQSQATVEEIVVTARKKAEGLQMFQFLFLQLLKKHWKKRV